MLLGIFAVGVAVSKNSDYNNGNELHGATWVIWVVVILVLLLTVIGLWAAIRLFQATKLVNLCNFLLSYMITSKENSNRDNRQILLISTVGSG